MTSFSILVNGRPYGNVLPSRGIRRGDSLSPYLFLLCTEGFTLLLDRAEIGGTLHGVSFCRNAPKIINLLFADDSSIFSKASPAEIHAIVEILQVYARASRQCINLEKSSVKQEALGILGVKEVSRFESYLGLPTLVGREKYHTFSFIKDRVWKKLQGWKGMMLSRAGKEVLIKAVAQAIPTYTMSVF